MAEIEGIFLQLVYEQLSTFPHTSVESEQAFSVAQIVPSLENNSKDSSSLIILIYSFSNIC